MADPRNAEQAAGETDLPPVDPIPPFNPDAACSRCGRTPVGTRSCATSAPYWGDYGIGSHWPTWVDVVGAHMHRTCGRCDHEWIELALDARMMTPEERNERAVKWKADADKWHAMRFPKSHIAEPETKKRWPFK